PINPLPAQNNRCIQTCMTNADCDVDDDELNRRFNLPKVKLVCQPGPPGQRGVCMEGILPPQQCINGPQQYDLHGSEAFVVVGSLSGYVHPIIAKNGACVVDPALPANTPQIGRIPLKAPACDPTSDPITGQLPGGGFEPNPCSLTVSQSEVP